MFFSQEGEARSKMRCQVESYSGYRLHEHPRRFGWDGAWLEVQKILTRWVEPGKLSFKVATADGRLFLLKYSRVTDTWDAKLLPGGCISAQPGRSFQFTF
jgi:hypothetical protein